MWGSLPGLAAMESPNDLHAADELPGLRTQLAKVSPGTATLIPEACTMNPIPFAPPPSVLDPMLEVPESR